MAANLQRESFFGTKIKGCDREASVFRQFVPGAFFWSTSPIFTSNVLSERHILIICNVFAIRQLFWLADVLIIPPKIKIQYFAFYKYLNDL